MVNVEGKIEICPIFNVGNFKNKMKSVAYFS